MKNIKLFISTLLILALIYGASLLISTYIIPTIRIYDESMKPNLNKDDVLIYRKTKNINKGDIVAFYVDDKILIKRCVATSGDVINIDETGNIYINEKIYEEKYIAKKEYGKVSIDLPYRVKDNSIFVLSDDRNDPSDSRNTLIGTINKEQIIGKVIFRLYPFKNFGSVK